MSDLTTAAAAAAPTGPVPMADPDAYLLAAQWKTVGWRCACGATPNPSAADWRWTGTGWQHHHGGQAGHFPATYTPPAPPISPPEGQRAPCPEVGDDGDALAGPPSGGELPQSAVDWAGDCASTTIYGVKHALWKDFIKLARRCDEAEYNRDRWMKRCERTERITNREADALRAQLAAVRECQWTHDEYNCAWDTACGEKYCFKTGGPVENSVRFCHGCGGCMKIENKEEQL